MTPPTAASISALTLLTQSELQEGDLFFYSGTDAISRIIEDATDSVWSHVGILTYDDRLEGWQVLEARQPQVIPTPLHRYLSDNYNTGEPATGQIAVARWDGAQKTTAEPAVSFALDQVGDGYGTLTVAEILALIVDRMLPPITPNGKTWICSQLVQSAYLKAGLTIPTDANGFCDPGDCWAPPQIQAVGRLSATPMGFAVGGIRRQKRSAA